MVRLLRRPLAAAALTAAVLVTVLRHELVVQTRPAAIAPLVAAPTPTAQQPTVAPTLRPAAPRRGRRMLAPRAPAPQRPATTATRAGAQPAAPVVAPVVAQPSPAHSTASTPRPAPKPSPTPVSGTFTGSTSSTPYGPVQVRITLTGGRITDVTALQMPSGNPRSQQLSAQAGPQLRQEALAAQSANIDDVSGATYTSEGYKQSLQAAIDQAHR